MPEDSRAQRRRILNRRQSVRLATKATRQAIAELPPHLKSRAAGVGSRPILKETTKFGALATFPNITFGVNRGRLINRGEVLGTARHEVAHLLGASPSVASGHVAFKAVKSETPSEMTAQGVVSAVRAQQEPFGRRIQRAATQVTRRSRSSVASPRTAAPSFDTPHLRKVQQTGTPSQQSRSRELGRRLGRRMRSRGVDF